MAVGKLSLEQLLALNTNFVDGERAAIFMAMYAIAERIERLAIAVEKQVKPPMPMMEDLLTYPTTSQTVGGSSHGE